MNDLSMCAVNLLQLCSGYHLDVFLGVKPLVLSLFVVKFWWSGVLVCGGCSVFVVTGFG